jgi:hypothetical protein
VPPPFDIWDDVPALNPRRRSWMMPPRRFAAARPGRYRGYRSASPSNLRTGWRSPGAFVAQNAVYASAYWKGDLDRECRLWRVELAVRRPVAAPWGMRDLERFLRAVPPGADAVFLPWGDGNMGNGPVIVAVDPACIASATQAMTLAEVQVAIHDGRLGEIPPECLADYPAVQDRLDLMRERFGEDFPAARF